MLYSGRKLMGSETNQLNNCKNMINLPAIIAGIVAKFLDAIKVKSPRWWAIIGALVISIENLLLAKILPFSDQIPVLVTETFVALAAIFLNASSFNLSQAKSEGKLLDGTIGTWIDGQLAVLVEKFKAGSLTAFTAVQIAFTGFKFYIVSDPTLTWGDTTVNIILSVLMIVLAPRTKPVLAKLGLLPVNIEQQKTRPGAAA